MLLCVLIVIGTVNTSTAPDRFPTVMILEFLSTCVLSLTLTLALFFVEDTGDGSLSQTASVSGHACECVLRHASKLEIDCSLA